mmetsp:Transcript_3599/g.9257  ORF Transcript_3599/g.9257 Transcript_3599/m.9257 type:complete len:183 (+) Transcript_3599:21-569(+)
MDQGSPSKVWFAVGVGSEDVGRIDVELNDSLAPRSCRNFRRLCEGESLVATPIDRIVRGSTVSFDDDPATEDPEDVVARHDRPGLVSTAGKGFVVTLRATPHFDGRRTVVGRVVSGMEVLRHLETLETDARGAPIARVDVWSCGVVADRRRRARDGKRKRRKKEADRANKRKRSTARSPADA